MKHSILAKVAGVSPSDVSNYHAWLSGDSPNRLRYLTAEKLTRIEKAREKSQYELIEWHFQNRTTPLTIWTALTDYGIGALSQRVGELNARYARRGEKRRIVNTQTERGIGKHAIYELREGE